MKRLLPDITNVLYAPSAEAATAPGFLLFVRGLALSSITRGATLMAQPFDPKRLEFTGDAVPIAEHVPPRGFWVSTTGELVYQQAGSQATRQLTWYGRDGKVLGTPGEPGDYNQLALSPDAAQVAYRRGSDLAVFEFARGVNTPFTFGNASQNPVWSPDGSRIGFFSIRGGGFGLYQKASNGAGQEQLLFQSPNPAANPSWSHDGRFLVYDGLGADAKTQDDIFVLPLTQGADRKPFLSTQFNEFGGRFSPDGRWIAYQSNRSGRFEIYVLPFDASNPASGGAGGLRQISKDGGDHVRWRSDGKELFFDAPDGSIMSVDVNGSGAAFLSETPKALFKATPPVDWDVTADGKSFLVAAPSAAGAASSSYQVVLNWPQMLKK
jgi:eukaryotic-like serine/threonine-protein kinase